MLSLKTDITEEMTRAMAEGYEQAPIPEVMKGMFRWAEKFVRHSWEMSEADIQGVREAGASDRDIADWALMAGIQTSFVTHADCGGADFPEQGGPVIGRNHDYYRNAMEGMNAAEPGTGEIAPHSADNGVGWIATDTSDAVYQEQAERATRRWGTVPNLLLALSGGCSPSLLPYVASGLERLERPQSTSFSPQQHAMVRALSSSLNRSPYSEATIKALFERNGLSDEVYRQVTSDYREYEWDPMDRLVLDFACKVNRHSYKVVEKDVQRFRDIGLDDEAYMDVVATVGMQMALDRIANALGVPPDEAELIA